MLCKIWGFHSGDYEECRLLGYKTPVRTSQETHYVSATESSQLMLCKILSFHGSDYEEFRLLGHKTPVRTSQETLHISVTESSQLMLCNIWGFHSGEYEECRLRWYKKISSYFTGDTSRLHQDRLTDWPSVEGQFWPWLSICQETDTSHIYSVQLSKSHLKKGHNPVSETSNFK
jgi:hypothetical protein